MAIQSAAPPFRLDLEHSEQAFRVFSALTFDPYKNILFYIFPFLEAFFLGYVEIRENDLTQKTMMPETSKSLILKELKILTEYAGIKRKVIPYSALKHTFTSSGGSLSGTSPAICLPHHLFFQSGSTRFETPEGSQETENFTDDEIRFLTARELGHISKNDVLIRIAIKISLIAATFIFYATPLGWVGGLLCFITALGLYFLSERCFQLKMDGFAIDLLTKRFEGNRERAKKAALGAMKKMQDQNIQRRKTNKLCWYYITPKGNNLIDFANPFLTTRQAAVV